MKRTYTPALGIGIGAVAGLRALTAPAVLAWAAKCRLIRLGSSPFATIISATASKRITDFAVSELIADKLPFTPSRLNAAPLASRIVSGAICGATIYGVVKRRLTERAVLGGLGAIAGAFAGYSLPWLTALIHSSLLNCADSSSTGLDHSGQRLHTSLAPFNLHKSRVRRASGFLLTAFSNATPHTFLQP